MVPVSNFASTVGLKAIRVGIVATFLACLAYPLAAFGGRGRTPSL